MADTSPLSDTDLSRELKVSKQTISSWKVGRRSPKAPTILIIAQYFNVSVEWLMGFDVEKYGSSQKTATISEKRQALINLLMNIPDEKIELFSRIAESVLEDARKGS